MSQGPDRPADAREVELEQRAVSVMFRRLDELRVRAVDELARVRRAPVTGTPQSRSERDAFAAFYEDRVAQLGAVEHQLCFGRLDFQDGERFHIGRIGLVNEAGDRLLVDWRSPRAGAFYQATAANPQGVVLRRHISTSGRVVVAVEDEALDLAAAKVTEGEHLSGEAALMAAIEAPRTGRMGDIVATIQAEQDEVIRSDPHGILVVQGGPGTGKTAVALHRTAYLLYSRRRQLARSGVLLVGPSELFLRYISRVLPGLGESGVVTATPGTLFPGVTAETADPVDVARLKGDLRMVAVLAAAVRARQRVPDRPRRLDVHGTVVTLEPAMVARARARARATRRPHNAARRVFVAAVLDDLADRLAAQLGGQDDDRPDLIADLRDSPDVRREVNLAWMPLTPQRVLRDLYAAPDRLAGTVPGLSAGELRLLHRDHDRPWTVDDVPLLDELAELLGEDEGQPSAAVSRQDRQRREELEYARDVVRLFDTSGILAANPELEGGPELLAERMRELAEPMEVAARAQRDRSWAFGHVVVDEAQELSPMFWRLLLRRCPARSMTVVGDLAQSGAAAAPRSWSDLLGRQPTTRWRLAELTVGYRTPTQIMDLAVSVLTAAGVAVTPPRAVRRAATDPVAVSLGPDGPAPLAAVVDRERGAGRLAVIVPPGRAATVRAALGVGAADLDAATTVLEPAQVKGLEFDTVVLYEPAEFLTSPRGAHDLYVALTRATQRLVVAHVLPLPAGFESLVPLAVSG